MTTKYSRPSHHIEVERLATSERNVAIWFLLNGDLHWFAFADRRDAVRIAARAGVLFRRSAVILPYDWEPLTPRPEFRRQLP